MLLEEAIKLAKDYYLDKEVPKNTREWRSNCPPELTAGKINSMPFTVGDVLRAVNPEARSRSSKVDYDLDTLGFDTLTFQGSKGTYVCSNCKNINTSERSSILKWLKNKTKYCPSCREVPGITKTAEYYSEKLPEGYKAIEVLSQAGNTKVLVEHITCGNRKLYSSKHILSSEYLVCSHCEGLGSFSSKQEKLICEHILDNFSYLNPQFQVPYSELASTSRRWVLDVYFPSLKLALEITTKGNGYMGYFDNLNDKLEFLSSNNYCARVVYSVTEVDDIVRSLLKDKES